MGEMSATAEPKLTDTAIQHLDQPTHRKEEPVSFEEDLSAVDPSIDFSAEIEQLTKAATPESESAETPVKVPPRKLSGEAPAGANATNFFLHH
jgi:hypothetical protein